jgi:hypothetical protein
MKSPLPVSYVANLRDDNHLITSDWLLQLRCEFDEDRGWIFGGGSIGLWNSASDSHVWSATIYDQDPLETDINPTTWPVDLRLRGDLRRLLAALYCEDEALIGATVPLQATITKGCMARVIGDAGEVLHLPGRVIINLVTSAQQLVREKSRAAQLIDLDTFGGNGDGKACTPRPEQEADSPPPALR